MVCVNGRGLMVRACRARVRKVRFPAKQSSAEVSTLPELVPATASSSGELELITSWLVEAARGEGIALTGEGGLLPALVARVLETGLGAELTEHLGYDRHSPQGYGSGNSRNGFLTKTTVTEVGPVEVRVPRDRSATFEPELVPHGTRRLDGLSEQAISLYAQGLTTGEIQAHLKEEYPVSSDIRCPIPGSRSGCGVEGQDGAVSPQPVNAVASGGSGGEAGADDLRFTGGGGPNVVDFCPCDRKVFTHRLVQCRICTLEDGVAHTWCRDVLDGYRPVSRYNAELLDLSKVLHHAREGVHR